ncbi:MAG: hypothetical protein ABIR54_04980 [Burkholderiaceae bacterium]|jgi:hypothetical protein
MNATPRHVLTTATLIAALAASAWPAQAADSRSEDRQRYFQMSNMDADKDGMVSKKEFMAMVAKTWDMHMADMAKDGGAPAPKMKDKMTLEQYREFAHMFGLDIGN